MSAYVHVPLVELESARVVIRGMAFFPDGDMEGTYVDRRRLRREIRRAYRRVMFMSDLSPIAWHRLARKQGVRGGFR